MNPAAMVLMAALLAGAGDKAAPGIERIDCPVDVSWTGETIDCHIVTVPLDHDDPTRGEIELAVMRIHSWSSDPQPDPVVYLEGGPGGAPIFYFDTWLGSPILDQRDIILVDQRGTGFSWPSLGCPETFDAFEPEEVTDALVACRQRFGAEGFDLSLFNSVQNAHDLDMVRQALGVDRWNLYGISYGTRVALTVMRLYPESVRSAILDSTVPPDVDLIGGFARLEEEAMAKLVAGCADDDTCRERYGDLQVQMDRVRERLGADGEPIDIPWLDGTDTFYQEYVTAEDFQYGVGIALYDSTLIPILPWIIDRVAGGDDVALGTLMAMAWYTPPPEGQADGAYYAVLCTEETPFVPRASMEAERRASEEAGFPALEGICAAWDLQPADSVESEPVHSEAPTLILAGGFDPATPPEWGSIAAETLPNSRLVVVEGGGHGVSIDGCGLAVAVEFLDDPTAPVSAGCATDRTRFVISPVPVSQIDLINGNTNEFGAALLAILAWMMVGITGVAMWRWKIGGGFHHLLWMATLLVMAGHLVTVVIYLFISLGTVSSAPIFAQPGWTWPLFVAPFAGLALGITAMVLTLVAVARSKTPAWSIFPYGSLGFSVMLMIVSTGLAGLLPGI